MSGGRSAGAMRKSLRVMLRVCVRAQPLCSSKIHCEIDVTRRFDGRWHPGSVLLCVCAGAQLLCSSAGNRKP